MADLAYDETFISESFKIFQERGFELACYNSFFQTTSEDVIFITVSLLPSETVQAPDKNMPNEPFYSLFKALGSEFECMVTAINNPIRERVSINVFPNPSTDRVTLEYTKPLNSPVEILIFNASDKLKKTIYQPSTRDHINLDVSDLSAGLYFLKINTSSGIFYERLVVRK